MAVRSVAECDFENDWKVPKIDQELRLSQHIKLVQQKS